MTNKNISVKKNLTLALACTIVSTSVLTNYNFVLGETLETSTTKTSTESTDDTNLGYVDDFDKTKIMSVSISVDPEKWQEMLDNAAAEEYISADITINGETIKNVGIRPKGNSSLNAIAGDEETDRYSFKVKFDEYVDGQTWQGLDKLVLNNNYSDSTYMKEYLSYDIMNYIGVDASLYSFADISVNGETWGLYLALEEVDSSFLERTKDGEGELYKPESSSMDMGNKERPEGMPEPQEKMDIPNTDNVSSATTTNTTNVDTNLNNVTPPTKPVILEGEELGTGEQRVPQGGGGMGMDGGANGVSLVYTDDEVSSYSGIFDNAETKTNEEDEKRVIEAIKNLNEGTNLEKYVDVDGVLRYLAAHTFVVNLDSYSSNMGHNYYLYENDGQISMIPWDYNMSFGGFMSGDASSVVNFPIDTPVSGVSLEERPMIDKLLEVPEYKETYHKYLQEIIDGYFANGKFEETVNSVDELIAPYVENDPTAFVTYEEYQNGVIELEELGTLRAESVQGQLDGTVPSTTESQKTDPDKLIDASKVDMSLLGDSGMGGTSKEMPKAFENIEMSKMPQVMEVLSGVIGNKLSDEQKSKLVEIGLTDDNIVEIEQMLSEGEKILLPQRQMK